MADVQFNETELSRPAAAPLAAGGKVSGMTKLLIKTGFAKDQKGAERVWLVVAVLAIVLTGVVIATNFVPASGTPTEVIEP